uniref:Integrase zinc-binding domain-containing protein n=1 Tax=Lepeophtheirus salmonis TaxID=72036 RepID=A0A0K2T752_LEPSM
MGILTSRNPWANKPKIPVFCPVYEVDAEARRVGLVASTTLIITIYDLNNRKHLTTSLQIVCYVLRAFDAFNGKSVPKSLVLSAYENRRTLLLLIRTVQKQHFGDEYIRLQAGEEILRSSNILKLNPFFDMKEEIIRNDTRIRTSPVLLPAVKDGLVAKLILQHHRSNLHAGPNQTLHSLRHRYWIVKGFSIVKQVISKRCFVCEQFTAKTQQQMM